MTTIRRSRSSGGLTPRRIDFSVHTSSNPTPVLSNYLTGSQDGVRLVMRDCVSPEWKSKRKKRGWINNPAEFSSLTVTLANTSTTTTCVPSGGVTTTRTWSGDVLGFILGPVNANGYGDLLDTQYPDLVSVNSLLNGAVIECLSRVNPASSQSLVTVSELPKTIDLIAKTAARFVDARRACIRFDVLKLKQMFGDPPPRFKKYPDEVILWDDHAGNPLAKRNGKLRKKFPRKKLNPPDIQKMDEASKLWLEYRYGWSPLVHDLVDQLKAMDAEMRRLERANTQGSLDALYSKAIGLREHSATTKQTFTTAHQHGGAFTWEREINHEVVVRAYAYYRVMTSGILSRLNDFGVFDFPRAIVELCPFSFIAEWFVPIGDWAGALTPKVGVEYVLSGYRITDNKTVKRTLTGYTPTTTGPNSWPNSPVAIGASDGAVNHMWSRVVGLPVPTFPPLEVKLNFKRMADAAALMKRMR